MRIKNRRLINFILCVCLMVSMLPSTPASAADAYGNEAEVDGNYYISFSEALGQSAGKTLKLLDNCAIGDCYVTDSTSINLNGFNMTVAEGSLHINPGVTLTLTDGNTSVSSNPQANIFTIDAGGSLVITGGTYSFNPENYVSDSGYAITQSGAVYTVTTASATATPSPSSSASPAPSSSLASLDVEKELSWDPDNPKTAQITVCSDVPDSDDIKVLFLGTLCGAHNLKNTTLTASINSLAKNADVDYVLLNAGDTYSSSKAIKGNVKKGGEMDKTISALSSGNHASLAGFIDTLNTLLGTDPDVIKYDYIVLEFDGSRIAAGATVSDVSSVAKVMKAYYDRNSVIWVTDGFNKTLPKGSDPYGIIKYTPSNLYYTNSDTQENYLSSEQFRMLCSIFAPSYYLAHTDGTDATYYGTGAKPEFILDDSYSLVLGVRDETKEDRLYGTADNNYHVYPSNSRQLYYDKADELSDFLYMAVSGITMSFNDKIKTSDSDSVKVTKVELYATKSSDDTGWVLRNSLTVAGSTMLEDASGIKYVQDSTGTIKVTTGNTGENVSKNNLVTADAVDIKAGVEKVKLVISIEDSNGFTSCLTGPTVEEGKYVYKMNPNSGDATVKAFNVGEDTSTGTPFAEGNDSAEAVIVSAYTVDSTIVNGSQKYKDTIYASHVKTETYGGDTPVFVYTPTDGYAVKTITIDGNTITLVNGSYTSSTVTVTTDSEGKVTVKFPGISSDHTVNVVCEKIITVQYNVSGTIPDGYTNPDDVQELYGSTMSAAHVAASRVAPVAGYTFTGWYTDTGLTNTFDSSLALNDTNFTISSDNKIMLYGRWTTVKDFSVVKDVLYDGESIKDGSIYSNRTVTYCLEVTNNNPAAAMEIEFTDKVPEGLTLIEDSISSSGIYDGETGTITWELTIAKGGAAKVYFNATVPPDISVNTDYLNTAFVSKAEGEAYTGPGSEENNPGTAAFTGVPIKILTLYKEWSDGWEGHQAVDINVYANGEYLTSVSLDNDEYKTQTIYVDAVDKNGKAITYTYREVCGETEIGKGELNGRYKFDYTETPGSDNTATVKLTNVYQIGPEDLSISKTAAAQAEAGGYFTYTITVKNNRTPETATNITVEDTLPAALEVVSYDMAQTDSLTRGLTESDAQKYIWTIGTISSGQTATLKLKVKVPEWATAEEYVNTASVTSVGGTSVSQGTLTSPAVKTTVRNFTVEKVWHDSSGNLISDTSFMPEVTVTLKKNGVAYGNPVTLNYAGGWTYTWTQLPLYDGNGDACTYTVSENGIEGYTGSISYIKASDVYGDAAAEITNTRKTITVSYQYVGDDRPSDVKTPDSETVSYGTNYDSAGEPSANYYEFSGWYKDKECTIPYTDGTRLDDTSVPGGSLVLYGKWIRKTVTVSYQYVGTAPYGATLPSSATIAMNSAYNAAASQYVSGYTFAGWYTDAACTQKYTDGTLITKDTVLYGKWIYNTVCQTSYCCGKVKTGDDNKILLYTLLCGISASACAAVIFMYKHSKKKNRQ